MNQGHLTLDSVCESDPESIAGSGLHVFNWTQQRLLQGRNSGKRFRSLGLAPHFTQLQTMLECPLQHKTEDPRGELSSCYPQVVDEDHRFITRIDYVNMGRRVIFVVDVG